MMVRFIGVIVLLVAVVLPVGIAQATCRQEPALGPPLPASAPRDPVQARLGLDRVREISTGAGVTVAVVDSGVDGRHPKLVGALRPGYELSPVADSRGYIAAPGGEAEDCENHGTGVAALITARATDDDRVVGVAPGAAIVPIRFTVPFSQATDVMVAEAINLAAANAQVVNLSFALPVDKPVIRNAVAAAIARDVVVVAAAGNEHQEQPGTTWYPAGYDGVLAVAAVDRTGRPMKESNQGAWIDIAAPGSELTTAAAGGGGYVTVSGTSFATALVSGVAALVRAKYPTMPSAEVIARIKSTAVPVVGRHDHRVGAGVIDPFAALTAMSPSDRPSIAAGSVRASPRPSDAAVLTGVLDTALRWAGIALAAAVVAATAGAAVRRGARRRWHPGPVARADHTPPPSYVPSIELT